MGWIEYYKQQCCSFESNQEGYQRALVNLSRRTRNDILPDRPMNVVLGGFHPFNGTPEAFSEFWVKLHPNPGDRIIYFDFNKTAVQGIDSDNFPLRIQGRLEDLPFSRQSIDTLFMDCTPNFLTPKQLIRFGQGAAKSLRLAGLVLMMYTEPLGPLKHLDQILDSWRNKVPVYLHTRQDLQRYFPGLRLTLLANCQNFSLAVFARNDSMYPSHEGYPYIFDDCPAFVPEDKWRLLCQQANKIK